MSTEVNALLVFCEGSHDSAFVRMVLKKVIGYQVKRLKFSEMPSPFHKLFETAVKNHAAQDMFLDMTHKFFLPDTILRKNKNIVLIFNCGGKFKYDTIKNLLSDYIPLFEKAKTFAQGAEEVVQSVKYLFLYDSDAEGIDAIIDNLNRNFQQIDNKDFLENSWKNTTSDHGRIAKDKAVFVWGGTPNKGTLEDILMPMFNFTQENETLVDIAKRTMSEMFTWETDHCEEVRSVAELEKYHKAILTTVGQRKNPGASLTVILEHSGLITVDSLKACNITTGFAQFVEEFLEAAQ